MAIDLTRVNAIFEGDSRKTLWAKFIQPTNDTTLQTQAITQAIRMLTLVNGAALTTDASAEGDLKRHDVAVAIQALHILTPGKVLADGTMSGPKHIAADGEPRSAESRAFDQDEATWSREALMYLKGTANVVMPSRTLLIPSTLTMIRG